MTVMTAAVPIDAELTTLTLAGGLPGFAPAERFALVEVSASSPLFRLCSLDDTALEFVVAPPAVFFPDYAPDLDDASAARLGLTDDAEQVLLLVVLTIGADLASSTANLLAPLVINQRTRQAAQVVVDGDWPLRAPLRP